MDLQIIKSYTSQIMYDTLCAIEYDIMNNKIDFNHFD